MNYIINYIIIVELDNNAKLVYNLQAENGKIAVEKVLNQLNSYQLQDMVNIQVVREPVYKRI